MKDKDKRGDIGEMKKDAKEEIDEMGKTLDSEFKSLGPAELDSFVKKLQYPVKKQEIIDVAKKDGSSYKITSALQMLPEKYYSSADELTREIAMVM